MSRLKDLTGQRFGCIVAQEYIRNSEDNKGRGRWRCLCDCGAETMVNSDNIKRMKYGCRACSLTAMSSRLKDITSQRFGKLVVISRDENYKGKGRWLCICDCGNNHYTLGSHLRNGRTTECKECSIITRGITRRRHAIGSMPKTYWDSVISGAKKRKIELAISAEEAYRIIEKQNWLCALTGSEIGFRNKGRKNTASLDRIDSNLGYIAGNIQWVHKDINFMKRNMDNTDFINWCKKVSLCCSNGSKKRA